MEWSKNSLNLSLSPHGSKRANSERLQSVWCLYTRCQEYRAVSDRLFEIGPLMGFYSDIQPNKYIMGRVGFRKVQMGFSVYLLFLFILNIQLTSRAAVRVS